MWWYWSQRFRALGEGVVWPYGEISVLIRILPECSPPPLSHTHLGKPREDVVRWCSQQNPATWTPSSWVFSLQKTHAFGLSHSVCGTFLRKPGVTKTPLLGLLETQSLHFILLRDLAPYSFHTSLCKPRGVSKDLCSAVVICFVCVIS